MERDEADRLGATVDLAVCMAVWSFARLNLDYVEIEAFFDACSERLLAQGLNPTIVDEVVSRIKDSVNTISKGLNGKNKH